MVHIELAALRLLRFISLHKHKWLPAESCQRGHGFFFVFFSIFAHSGEAEPAPGWKSLMMQLLGANGGYPESRITISSVLICKVS